MTEERGKKRPREEAAAEIGAADLKNAAKPADDAPKAAPQEEEDDDDAPLVSNFKMSRAVCKGNECPYLDSISRQVTFQSSLWYSQIRPMRATYAKEDLF